MKQFEELCYKNLDDLIYGNALYSVKAKNGLKVGGGLKMIDECSSMVYWILKSMTYRGSL